MTNDECDHAFIERVEEIRLGDVVVYHVEWCRKCESVLSELWRRPLLEETRRLVEGRAVLRV